MKIISSVFSCLGTVVKRLGEGVSALYTSLVQRISSIWSRRPADSKASGVSLKGRVTQPKRSRRINLSRGPSSGGMLLLQNRRGGDVRVVNERIKALFAVPRFRFSSYGRNSMAGEPPSGLKTGVLVARPPFATSQQQPQAPVSHQPKKFGANTSGRSASHLPPPTQSFEPCQYGDGTEVSVLQNGRRPSSRRE